MRRAEAMFAKRELPDAITAATPVDTMPLVKHIVILMMENHSFDSHLGALGPDKGGFDPSTAPDPSGATDSSGATDPSTPSDVTDPSAPSDVTPHHRTTTTQFKHVPSQSWQASHVQWNNGANDGFARSAQQSAAFFKVTDPDAATIANAYWTEAELPFYYSLARTFPLCTRWFTPCLGPTFPNRRFLLAGTANGLMDDVLKLDTPPNGTILDVLTAHGIDWRNYHNTQPAKVLLTRILGMPGVRVARALALVMGALGPVRNYLIHNVGFTANLFPAGYLRVRNHTASLKQFFADAAGGTLPPVSIVDPDFEHWSEENPQDIQRGEGFAAAVINAVMDGPGWDGTVLVWLYDESGGYFDHVPPPPAVPPDDTPARSLIDKPAPVRALLKLALGKLWGHLRFVDDWPDRAYDRYGFRVPAVVVSPFAKRDCVTDTVFDHTSLLKFIEDKWVLPPLTQRDAHANSIMETLDFDQPGFAGAKPALAAPAKPFSLSEAG